MRSLTLSLLLLGAAGLAVAAEIAGLPTTVINGLEGPAEPRDISATVIATTPLAAEGLGSLSGRDLRARAWEILPGGVVPIHEHRRRPATIYTLQGEILEYRNDREDPVAHETGGLSLEEGADLAHWWLNDGDETVGLIAFDVVIADEEAIGGEAGDTPSRQEGVDLPERQETDLRLVGFVDLGAHFEGEFGEGLALSHYRAVLQPGGVLPTWTDPGEPVIAYLAGGELSEHGGGEAATRASGTGRALASGAVAWWENTGPRPAELHLGVVEPLADAENFTAADR